MAQSNWGGQKAPNVGRADKRVKRALSARTYNKREIILMTLGSGKYCNDP